ncbi:patatin-like phospholipase family protein [Pseudonocardia sp. DSM 110487]|uniref:patatin-like phospholipase family protein n=1 Tax=Pseudonocardia sp. DSM 110487 TaxID=2865833 RepID=UPI001C69591D|nr:patatin-like phospholipase family protein [Pseudonocardia sp. DSM 110487]QYN35260.1 patatin-like phospholipase family protein [Pseudonocardia sp. DSM 110487]
MGRALVLGGGGITGVAWELGMLCGLREHGVDLAGADLIVGTSAGAIVGAQLATGVDPEERYAAQLVPPDGQVAAALGTGAMLRLALAAIAGGRDPQRVRARIGGFALRARTGPESERIAVIGSRLLVHEWPRRALRITAVDARTGEFVVLDRDSGVPLVAAVAASCAVPGVWAPISTGGRRLVDGGVRSPTNADLAAGCDHVVVLAPIVRALGPIIGVRTQVAALREQGARVALVSPDADALAAIGRNVLDPAHRAAAARAGRAQAAGAAAEVARAWQQTGDGDRR